MVERTVATNYLRPAILALVAALGWATPTLVLAQAPAAGVTATTPKAAATKAKGKAKKATKKKKPKKLKKGAPAPVPEPAAAAPAPVPETALEPPPPPPPLPPPPAAPAPEPVVTPEPTPAPVEVAAPAPEPAPAPAPAPAVTPGTGVTTEEIKAASPGSGGTTTTAGEVAPGAPPPAPESAVSTAAPPAPEPSEARHILGVGLDLGVPDFAAASVLVRPVSYVRASGSLLYDYAGWGVRGGIAVLPYFPIAPSLNLEVGRFFESNANGKLPVKVSSRYQPLLDKFGYTFVSLQVGLEVGAPDSAVFFIRGGLSKMWMTAHNINQTVGTTSSTGTQLQVSDANLRLGVPSVKLGFMVYFF
jgi:hypothetical protein